MQQELVIKIGAVVLKEVACCASSAADGHAPAMYQILILQPNPKIPGEVPPFVLPRGSRQYQDADGAWHDVRDVETAMRHQAHLEPFTRTLAREVEEEAGVNTAMLARARVAEMGTRMFQSRSKGCYPIHWFVVILADADAVGLTDTLPVDATQLRWVTLDEAKMMAARGEFSGGYLPVMEAAITPSRRGQTPPDGAPPVQ